MSLRLLRAVLMLAAASTAAAPGYAQSCSAHSGPTAATVVELYTSEGCNSCPPADRWLSSLVPRAELVTLAFHVDYWDDLGWKDSFASPSFTQRQAQQRQVNGARYSYTPQVVVNGRDRPDWNGLKAPTPSPASTVEIELTRSGAEVMATVRSRAAQALAAYWAVTESGHSTAVRGGENRGVTLKHDHVVRMLQPVAAWSADGREAMTLRFSAAAMDAQHPRRINFVVTDARSGRPVQAAWIGC